MKKLCSIQPFPFILLTVLFCHRFDHRLKHSMVPVCGLLVAKDLIVLISNLYGVVGMCAAMSRVFRQVGTPLRQSQQPIRVLTYNILAEKYSGWVPWMPGHLVHQQQLLKPLWCAAATAYQDSLSILAGCCCLQDPCILFSRVPGMGLQVPAAAAAAGVVRARPVVLARWVPTRLAPACFHSSTTNSSSTSSTSRSRLIKPVSSVPHTKSHTQHTCWVLVLRSFRWCCRGAGGCVPPGAAALDAGAGLQQSVQPTAPSSRQQHCGPSRWCEPALPGQLVQVGGEA